MILFDCPHCWTRLQVKRVNREITCEICGTAIPEDEIEEVDAKDPPRRGTSPFHRPWRLWLWMALIGCGVIGGWLALMAYTVDLDGRVVVGVGIACIVAAIGMRLAVGKITPSVGMSVQGGAGGAAGGAAGVFVGYLFQHAERWPQPAIALFLGMILIGIGAERNRAAERQQQRAERSQPVGEDVARQKAEAEAGEQANRETADPRTQPDGPAIYLTYLGTAERNTTVFHTGLDGHGVPAMTFRARDTDYKYGIYFPPDAFRAKWVAFNLKKEFKRLKGSVAHLPHGEPCKAAIFCKVSGDGKELWSEQGFETPGTLTEFDIDVAGVGQLKLETGFVEFGDPGALPLVPVVWLDPWVEK